MNKNVLPSIFWCHKAKPFGNIKPLAFAFAKFWMEINELKQLANLSHKTQYASSYLDLFPFCFFLKIGMM